MRFFFDFIYTLEVKKILMNLMKIVIIFTCIMSSFFSVLGFSYIDIKKSDDVVPQDDVYGFGGHFPLGRYVGDQPPAQARHVNGHVENHNRKQDRHRDHH